MAWAGKMNFVWTYVAGPILALLPERWRRAGPWHERARWEPAGTVSGIAEMIAAVTTLGYWYMYEMTRRIAQIMEMADSGKLGPGLGEHQIQGAALMLFYMSTLTWILVYFFAEGALRLCAALTGKTFGSLPLWIVERAGFAIGRPREMRVAETVRENAQSIATSVRERMMVARLEELDDELRYQTEGGEEILEIWACRRKADWEPPRTVKVDELFYRLEEIRVGAAPRPFQYRLRKVAAGVMGRTVIQYWTK